MPGFGLDLVVWNSLTNCEPCVHFTVDTIVSVSGLVFSETSQPVASPGHDEQAAKKKTYVIKGVVTMLITDMQSRKELRI